MPSAVQGADTGSIDGLGAGATEGVVLFVKVVFAIGHVVEGVGFFRKGFVAHLAIVARGVPTLSEGVEILALHDLSAASTGAGEVFCEVGPAVGLSVLFDKARLKHVIADIAPQVVTVPGRSQGKDDLSGDQLPADNAEMKEEEEEKVKSLFVLFCFLMISSCSSPEGALGSEELCVVLSTVDLSCVLNEGALANDFPAVLAGEARWMEALLFVKRKFDCLWVMRRKTASFFLSSSSSSHLQIWSLKFQRKFCSFLTGTFPLCEELRRLN